MSASPATTWLICAATFALILLRPRRWPEAVWAVLGAALAVVLGGLPIGQAAAAAGRGLDVYLFLIGMMLMSEAARREGLFDAAAVLAVNLAAGSTWRLLALVYGVGVVVTVFLSNDATAVVLTPAVLAVARRAKADPWPLLLACALVANAASFGLPISNPANLVLYGAHPPTLGAWLGRLGPAALAAIAATFAALALTQRRRLAGACEARIAPSPTPPGAWTALAGLGAAAAGLMAASALGLPLGAATLILAAMTVGAVSIAARRPPWAIVAGVNLSIIPLVAGLFVLVEALQRTGLTDRLAQALTQAAAPGPAALAGAALALVCNLVNNLPAGLTASVAAHQAQAGPRLTDALLIGVDLGPNLSVTGSLATLLWLAAIRREGERAGGWAFLKVGALAMPLALAAALAVRMALG